MTATAKTTTVKKVRRSSTRKPRAQAPPPETLHRFRDPHVVRGLRYCEQVVTGLLPACLHVRRACQRQLDDLRRYEGPTSRFHFDEKEAGRACRFIELLPHIEGPCAFIREDGQPNCITLEPWQCFIVTTLFGWLRRDTGGRRFRRAYIEVPRSNGKSALLSCIALYGLAADGEAGPQVYTAATTREQASVVYNISKKMMRTKKAFAKKLGVVPNDHVLLCTKNNGEMKALSREAKSLDGKNVHVVIIDELHAHQTREVYDVLETALGKRLSSLLVVITTAGIDAAGICYEVRTFVAKLLQGLFQDETQFGIIYTLDLEPFVEVLGGVRALDHLRVTCSCGVATPTVGQVAQAHGAHLPSCQVNLARETEGADAGQLMTRLVGELLEVRRPGDDWTQEVSWRKANPNWGVSVMPDEFAALAQKAMQLPTAQANFKTKKLNIWCNAYQAAFDLRHWDRCADPALTLDQFVQTSQLRQARPMKLTIGLDLATKIDLVAKVYNFSTDLPCCVTCGRVELGHPPPRPEAPPVEVLRIEAALVQAPVQPELCPRFVEGPDTEKHHFIFTMCYVPEARCSPDIDTTGQYQGWVLEGWLKATPGEVIDFDLIELDLQEDRDLYAPKEVVYDPWQATQLAKNLESRGFDGGRGPTMVELRATTQNYSQPMKDVDALMRQGRIHHDGNPLMRWMISNVVAKKDAKENIYPCKEQDANKIDGPVALIASQNRAGLKDDEGPYGPGRGVR